MEPIELPPEEATAEIPDITGTVLNRTVARRTLLIAFALIGLALAGLTVLGAVLFDRINTSVRLNEEAIHRLDRIQHPTPEQFEKDLREGIKRCLKSRECRKLFPEAARSSQRGTRARTTPTRSPGTSAGLAEGQGGTAGPRDRARRRPRAGTDPPRRRGSPPSPPPQSSGGAPPDSAITLTAPLAPPVCAPPVVRVNCP